MFPTTRNATAALALAMTMLTSSAAAAATLTYEAQDLPDVVPGTDLWRYIYTLSDVSLSNAQGLQVFFDVSSFSQLANAVPDASDPGWDVLLLQPDTSLPADGVFDALSLASHPAPVVFSVDYAWTGVGSPATQTFALYDLVADQVEVFETGVTQSATNSVPEPAIGVLFGIAAALSAIRKRR